MASSRTCSTWTALVCCSSTSYHSVKWWWISLTKLRACRQAMPGRAVSLLFSKVNFVFTCEDSLLYCLVLTMRRSDISPLNWLRCVCVCPSRKQCTQTLCLKTFVVIMVTAVLRFLSYATRLIKVNCLLLLLYIYIVSTYMYAFVSSILVVSSTSC